ncbi:uncharacterized protein LOC129906287 isoform X4 [Episyrphus balteatus]|uniref:uncharacterized protein LOC129906287 isoform X4 n=1 Tax=Episyrphus balteatus TaxID=286459 RepID=UPI002486A816|nr:uncharacterized protein LOC129906287 isoform X4 [Episyrphus balteatus]
MGEVSLFLWIAFVISLMLIIRSCLRAFSKHEVRAQGLDREIRRTGEVRQAAVYTIATDPRRGNDSTSNFPDFFWDVSPPRSNEPAKDDKDLPSYEEVMRIEMARQVVDSTIQATPITTSTTTNTVQQTLPSSQPVRLPV